MDGAVSKSFWAPPTFAERGASVPFTTPIIVGSRIRGRQDRLELVVPNPSGAKGNYMKKISISSTMGPGVKIALASVGAGGAAA